MSDTPHRRRTHRRRWRLPLGHRTGVLLGGVALIVAVAIALPFVFAGGPGASARASAQASSGPAASEAALGPTAGTIGSAIPGASTGPSADTSPGHGVVATRIKIARLGIDLPVVEGDGVDAPLYKVAHYPGTAWPGGGSNIYLYGHARDGMFLSLWNAKAGDLIVLDLKGGGQRTYVVTKVMPKVAWDDMALLAPTPHEQLTLQTCTSYEQTAPRFVVIAVPQS